MIISLNLIMRVDMRIGRLKEHEEFYIGVYGTHWYSNSEQFVKDNHLNNRDGLLCRINEFNDEKLRLKYKTGPIHAQTEVHGMR